MEQKNIYGLTPMEIYPGEGSFEMTVGGTTYEVTTHFSDEGTQSILEQFKELIMKEHLI